MKNTFLFILLIVPFFSCSSHKDLRSTSKPYVMPTDSTQILSYKEARKYVAEKQRFDIHRQFKKIHLNWYEYQSKPHTLADLKKKIDEARQKPHRASITMLKAPKGHKEKERHRIISFAEQRQLKDATDSVRIEVRRQYYINDDEEVSIEFIIKIQETDERYMVVDECVNKSEVLYWTKDGIEHQRPITLRNPVIELDEYHPQKLHFSATFKYRGKWYYFYATENNNVTTCKPVK